MTLSNYFHLIARCADVAPPWLSVPPRVAWALAAIASKLLPLIGQKDPSLDPVVVEMAQVYCVGLCMCRCNTVSTPSPSHTPPYHHPSSLNIVISTPSGALTKQLRSLNSPFSPLFLTTSHHHHCHHTTTIITTTLGTLTGARQRRSLCLPLGHTRQQWPTQWRG
ncbi:unnamed protein product [Closterium sp. NIES-53]